VTADHVLVFVSDRMANREWGYVAGSRHRDELHIYSDRSVFAGIAEALSRSNPKTMAIDEFPLGVVQPPKDRAPANDDADALPSPPAGFPSTQSDPPQEPPPPQHDSPNDPTDAPDEHIIAQEEWEYPSPKS
jgi:hypothetical protein